MAKPAGILLRWIWQNYLRKFWLLAAIAFVLMAVEGGMLGLFSYMVQPMFDRVLVAGERSEVIWVALAVSGVFAVRAISGFSHRVIMNVIGNKVVANIRKDLTSQLLKLDLKFFEKHSPGALISRVIGDSESLANLWNLILSAVGRDLVALVSLFAVALSIDWVWTLVAIAGAPLLLLPMLVVQRRIRALAKSARVLAAGLSNRLDEVFHGIRTIKLNQTYDREVERFNNQNQSYTRYQNKTQIGLAAIPALMDMVAAIGFFGVLVYGGYQIIDGEKTVGQFMSFFTAMALVFEPLRRLGAVSGAVQVALSNIERIEELIADLKQRFTIVIVTHNMAQAKRASDECIYMYLGKIIEHSPTAELFVNPKEEQTAMYIEGRYG